MKTQEEINETGKKIMDIFQNEKYELLESIKVLQLLLELCGVFAQPILSKYPD